jgi:molybdenum cofactor cytidylyltransferase
MISAVVLAAGLSRRMGRPKMTLPWGDTTVIGQVVTTLAQAGVEEIVVVTGAAREKVEVEALRCAQNDIPVRCVFNSCYADGSMMSSLQTGLTVLGKNVEATFVALGDQPQIEAAVVRALAEAYQRTRAPLVVPSYRMRRGHPWLLGRSLWAEALAAPISTTLRELLNTHASHIHYVLVESPSILQDLDTPDDHERSHP